MRRATCHVRPAPRALRPTLGAPRALPLRAPRNCIGPTLSGTPLNNGGLRYEVPYIVAPRPALSTSVGVTATQDSLYKRLGGYDAIAAVTDDFIGRLVTDPSLGKFFVQPTPIPNSASAHHAVDFLGLAYWRAVCLQGTRHEDIARARPRHH